MYDLWESFGTVGIMVSTVTRQQYGMLTLQSSSIDSAASPAATVLIFDFATSLNYLRNLTFRLRHKIFWWSLHAEVALISEKYENYAWWTKTFFMTRLSVNDVYMVCICRSVSRCYCDEFNIEQAALGRESIIKCSLSVQTIGLSSSLGADIRSLFRGSRQTTRWHNL